MAGRRCHCRHPGPAKADRGDHSPVAVVQLVAPSLHHLLKHDVWTEVGIILPQGALVMPLMARGYSAGLIKFNLITAEKPK